MKLLATSLAVAAVLALPACGDDSNDTSSGTTPTTAAKVTTTTEASSSESTAPSGESASTVKLVDSDFGKILADGDGNTLYLFTPDTSTTSACTGGCITAWPPLVGPATGDGLDAEDFGTLTRDDGTEQVVFYGHPLYRYSADSAPGDTTGQGSGGKWYVVDADGNPVKDTAASTTGKSGY